MNISRSSIWCPANRCCRRSTRPVVRCRTSTPEALALLAGGEGSRQRRRVGQGSAFDGPAPACCARRTLPLQGRVMYAHQMPPLPQFLSQAFNGIALGSLLALIASGLSIILGTLGVLNFAHGAMFMLGAYTAFVVLGHFDSFALALDRDVEQHVRVAVIGVDAVHIDHGGGRFSHGGAIPPR